jgi:hypothetical protein
MPKLAPIAAVLVAVGVALAPTTAHAHSVPRLYAAIGPTTAWDPVAAHVFVGGTVLLGFGVDPERDALLIRSDTFGVWSRQGAPGIATGASILYRIVLRDDRSGVWTLALGPGALGILGRDDQALDWGVAGVRGELAVRFGSVRLCAFALTGVTLGRDARLPVGGPVGIAIDLGAP